ncbi:MAG: M6 family metalloprotease domain-containing protein, partial [candidate division Zixibacteria bacterium]|nr:M6 family metalloprotease domain-containing protein [candidate division Zixibacteria bacterium]
PYDNDGLGSIDGVVVIHAGPAAETGQYGIWSHRSNLSPSISVPGSNKYISAYTMNPEEYGNSISPIGVFCHEYGHILQLPDLYDTDPSHTTSEGLGAWSLMASGNYNGDSKLPAHLDPWSKWRAGFMTINDHLLLPGTNLSQAPIPQAESEPFVYQIALTSAPMEYFLIENRQWYGFDAGLPGEGLLIYHIDELQPNNDNPAHYKVALVQADGLNSLAFGGSRGDYGDPFPGTSHNRNWHDLSAPNSRLYSGVTTEFAAWNISNSDSVMYADLDTRWSRPWIVLSGTDSLKFSDIAPGGNGNGILEAGETISFSFGVKNLMRLAYGHSATLSCDDPGITFSVNGVEFEDILSPAYLSPIGPLTPIKFTIPSDWSTHVVHFNLRMVMDSLPSQTDTTWNKTFSFSQPLGKTNVLLVDDDNGNTLETRYTGALTRMGIPYAIWNCKILGSPLPIDLAKYKNVFWFTGLESGGGAIDDMDISGMKAFLNGGGNLCLASVTAPGQIAAIDNAFLQNYLHTQNGGLTPDGDMVSAFVGVSGNPVGNGINVGFPNAPVTFRNMILNPVNGGQAAFTLKDEFGTTDFGNGGVTYSGSYRTVFLSFGMETLEPTTFPLVLQPIDTLIQRVLTFFQKGSATGVDDGTQATIPDAFALSQNYPNPFNPSTVIAYTIPAGSRPQRTTITIYNVMGQSVATLADRVEGPGQYSVTWDTQGKAASGTYYYRLSHGGETLSRKMILLK